MIPRTSISTLTIILWTLTQISAQKLPELPQALIDYMSSREMRLHHYLFHNVRNLWLSYDEDTRNVLRFFGWEPLRPSLRYDAEGQSTLIVDNNSGEDFLYMHRQMIAVANQIISEQDENYSPISGFSEIPRPDSKDYPVPPAYETPDADLTQSIINFKSDDFYWNTIKPREDYFKDPNNLRRMTLGRFGSLLEFTVHNWLHMRFSEKPIGIRPTPSGLVPDIDEKWDGPAYDWLGDTYSSQVNPWFWKIHGWVDDRINDWQRANGVRNIRWKGTWVGGPMNSLPPVPSVDEQGLEMGFEEDDGVGHAHDPEEDVMEQVGQAVVATGLESNFFDPVQTPLDSLTVV